MRSLFATESREMNAHECHERGSAPQLWVRPLGGSRALATIPADGWPTQGRPHCPPRDEIDQAGVRERESRFARACVPSLAHRRPRTEVRTEGAFTCRSSVEVLSEMKRPSRQASRHDGGPAPATSPVAELSGWVGQAMATPSRSAFLEQRAERDSPPIWLCPKRRQQPRDAAPLTQLKQAFGCNIISPTSRSARSTTESFRTTPLGMHGRR